ncbi:SusC/RagA family TonB-linked outer membrane protein [Pedobacter heparinus]|nr:SusC/RagA family TonB-linked outer membrane protein [Pedobacter heparinus]
MKLTIFILIIALVQVSARGFGQKITLNTNHTPIEKVLQSITNQSGYEILYDLKDLKDQKVSLKLNNVSVEEAIKTVLKDLPFTYQIIKNNIVLKKEEPSFLERLAERWADTDIRGMVRNERGEALEGITIMVKGAKTGTRTNANGEFVLKGVKKGDVLVFTGVAIEPFEYTVKDDKNIELNLKARLVQLEEVGINTGYQKISKERFVGSYSQLDSAAFHRRAGMGILERLDGTLPGILFNKKFTYVAGYNNTIQIRGINTINSNPNPLIVVDNFPMDARFDLNSINPNDVENITILKDAAASSIWGARAGNGVIVITTKKGKLNTSVSVTASSNVTIENRPNLYYTPKINTNDFIELEKELFSKGLYTDNLNNTNTWPVVSPVVELLNEYSKGEINQNELDQKLEVLKGIDIREELNKHIYRTGLRQQHHLTLNGGTNAIGYNFSYGYNTTKSNIQNSKGNQQYTLNTAVIFKPLKNWEIQTQVAYGKSKTQHVPPDLSWARYPYLQLSDIHGNALSVPYQIRTKYLDTINHSGLLDWQFRPLDEIKLTNNIATNQFTNINLGTSYKITDWLTASINYQYLHQINLRKAQNSIESYFTRDLVNKFFNPNPNVDPNLKYPVPIGSILRAASDQSSTSNGRASLSFNKFFGRHNIAAMVATEASETTGNGDSNLIYGYDPRNGSYKPNVDFYSQYPLTFATSLGNVLQIPNGQGVNTQSTNRVISLLANISYNFADKYYLYGSARRDGSNMFGVKTNNRWKPLWSIGSKWQLSKEEFFSSLWLQNLAIRTTYGYAGNPGSQAGRMTMIFASLPQSLTGLTYAQVNSINNPDLRWEKVSTFNLGADFTMWKGRLYGSMDMFWKKSTDLLANYPMDPSVGVNAAMINSADMKGNGFEVQLNSKNVQGPFSWISSFGVSYSKTIVTKVYQGGYRANDFISYSLNPSEGKLAFSFSSYKWAGLDPLTGDPQGYLNGAISKDYDAIFSDSIQNQVYHGSSIPLYSTTIGNTISYKNFSLSFVITGRFNYYFRKPALEINNTDVELGATRLMADYYQRWQKPGDEKNTSIPSVIYPVPPNLFSRSSFYSAAQINVLRADNIKLQDIRFGYTWIRKGNSQFPFKSGQFFFYPNNLNLIIWRKNNSSLDPDFSGGSSDPTLAPSPKTWTVGASINL